MVRDDDDAAISAHLVPRAGGTDNHNRMPDEPPPSADSPIYRCPACGALVSADVPGTPILQCGSCGGQFFGAGEPAESADAEAEPADADTDAAGSDEPGSGESDVSELRIRQAMHSRQAIYRRRRWPVMASAACLMAAAKLVQIAIVALGHGARLIPAGDLLAAAIALIIGAHFVHQTLRITRQIRLLRQPSPSAAPDFSTLSDGSQHWKNLEQIARAPGAGKESEPME